MSIRSKADWIAILDAIEVFLWIARNYTPAQLTKAMEAAKQSVRP